MRGMVTRAPKTTISVPSVPLVTIFVRHSTNCPHKGDSFYKRCQCRKSLRYFHDGKQRMQSAKTRSWALAEEAKRKLEDQFRAAPLGTVTIEAETVSTIERAIALFLSDKRSQGLDGGVLKEYERELGRFGDFMARRSRYFPHEIRLEDLTAFRAGWDDLYPSSTTRAKVQERLRAFLRYCYESQLIDRVPKLSPIKVSEVPTLPLTEKQYQKLLKVIPNEFTAAKAQRVHALVRLMRYSGLAIRDAVTLERDELKRDTKQGLYRIVTNVSVPIPPDVATEVKAAMELNENPRYVFWNTGTRPPKPTALQRCR
jgi:integrase/recombinase XerD